MSDSQMAKIIMALNNLSNARSIINEAVREGGDIAPFLTSLMGRIQECETELQLIQFQK